MNETNLKSNFNSHFLKANNIFYFEKWYFRTGMFFQDTKFWWDSKKQRKVPHEGLDLYSYANEFGNVVKLDYNNKFPLLFSGWLTQIFDDFQGKTLHVVHDIYEGEHNRLHSLYGHTKVLKDLNPGSYISEEFPIISAVTREKNSVPLHLHLTIFWAPKYLAEPVINWEYMNLMEDITLIDPLPLL